MPAILERINGQLCDLNNFYGAALRASGLSRPPFDRVLPVLCPQLSFEDIAIKDGVSASNEWWRMIAATTSLEEK